MHLAQAEMQQRKLKSVNASAGSKSSNGNAVNFPKWLSTIAVLGLAFGVLHFMNCGIDKWPCLL